LITSTSTSIEIKLLRLLPVADPAGRDSACASFANSRHGLDGIIGGEEEEGFDSDSDVP